MRRALATFLLLSFLIPTLFIAGCGRKQTAEAPPKPKGPPRVSQQTLDKHRPNEAGAVMVIMYHRVLADESDNDLNRRPDTFRKDLETLRAKGYYPVNALDLVTNNMNVPAGKTPVVITFDDALPSQFRVTEKDGNAVIDPNCAVGIMETFTKKNPDWPMRATFFVLPKVGRNPDPFGQAEYVADKFDYLASKGYEIANHSSTHANMRSMSADKVQWELATAVKKIREISETAPMQTLALPYGKLPRNAGARKVLLSGSNGGTSYEHKAVFQAAWRPVLSPLTKADSKLAQGGSLCVFNPEKLERVKPDANNPSAPGTLEYWLKWFEKNPSLRYVSDGEAKIAAIPAAQKSAIDEARAKAHGITLHYYGGSEAVGSGKKSGGGGLSVG